MRTGSCILLAALAVVIASLSHLIIRGVSLSGPTVNQCITRPKAAGRRSRMTPVPTPCTRVFGGDPVNRSGCGGRAS